MYPDHRCLEHRENYYLCVKVTHIPFFSIENQCSINCNSATTPLKRSHELPSLGSIPISQVTFPPTLLWSGLVYLLQRLCKEQSLLFKTPKWIFGIGGVGITGTDKLIIFMQIVGA